MSALRWQYCPNMMNSMLKLSGQPGNQLKRICLCLPGTWVCTADQLPDKSPVARQSNSKRLPIAFIIRIPDI
jgi:hypothetical protein